MRTFPLMLAAMVLAPLALRADDSPQLSAAKLDMLDQRGYFTPRFKDSVHQLVALQQEIAQNKEDERKLHQGLPDLQKQAGALQVQLTALRKELALYEHPEDSDYDDLQNALKNPATPLGDKLARAQAFVWSYPADPRQAEAEQDLRQVQKQISDQQQAEKDTEAAHQAARAKLLARAKARDLSLAEWGDFLRDMSQQDLLTNLGRPQALGEDYWTYTGVWTTDPATNAKAGLQVHFNGTRVMAVTPVAP